MHKFTFNEPDDLSAGWALIDELQREQVPVKAAMWLRVSEVDTWNFHILSPAVTTLGPLYVYKKINDILERCGDKISVNYDDIVVANTTNSIANAIYKNFSIGRSINYLSGMRINGQKIKCAYVYNVHQSNSSSRRRVKE
jgi:hypothetical protein